MGESLTEITPQVREAMLYCRDIIKSIINDGGNWGHAAPIIVTLIDQYLEGCVKPAPQTIQPIRTLIEYSRPTSFGSLSYVRTLDLQALIKSVEKA